MTKLIFIFVFSFSLCRAQQIVNIKFSKPFAILKFLETAKGSHAISKTYKHQIDTSYLSKNKDFKKLVRDYASINLDYVYTKNQFPVKRKHIASTWDLICIASISSTTNEEFFTKIIGVIPNSDYVLLKQIITQAEPFYDTFIYNNNKEIVFNKVRELQELSPKLNQLFEKFKSFYGSSWDKAIPFNLTLYPILGNRGQTTATPHANSLEMGVLTQEDDNFTLLSVGMHEMCHVLYDEQPLQIQEMIDDAFSDSTIIYSQFAYHYIDEALATALGNGYVYKKLTTELDTSEWYNDSYIDTYAKAIYPLVENYLDSNKQLDRTFIYRAISVFQKTFPNAIYEYEPNFINTNLYFETENELEVEDLQSYLHNCFRIYSSNTSNPILNAETLDLIKTSPETQVIFVYKNQAQTMLKLQSIFGKLIGLPIKNNMLINFIDKNNRAIIIVKAENLEKIKDGVKLMKTQKRFYTKPLYTEF